MVMTEFEGVVPALAEALNKRDYTVLTPVQQAVLAPEIRHADILVSAQTGSGKTVAFGMAIATDILGDESFLAPAQSPLALIVAPTRELAMQVKRELEWLYEMTGASFASCVGGMDMRSERRSLERGAHIVVGTPGRLRDHIERGSFDTSGLRVVVLDEADEMLDLGFRDDLEHILDSAPNDRRTLMFSATVPRSIEGLAKRYQRDAVRITTTTGQKQHLDIEYHAMTVAPNDEENAIVNVLRYYDAKNALVFCATRAAVNRLTSRFNNRGFSVVALSGELSQNERTHALQAMRDGRARVCVATDVAARGIDLPNLDLVIHAEPPRNKETLLHRSGRTGRAGRKGVCALIVPHNWRKRMERLLNDANIDAIWAKPPSAEDVTMRDHERLLSDPSLTEPITDIEKAVAEELLARHGAEQIAAAFIRQYFKEQAAPEELMDTVAVERPERQRDNFKDSGWISLSVGRDKSAEARWLLPMLCRAGHITKRDVGAIRIQSAETFVELSAGCIDKFMASLGPDAMVEQDITAARLDGPPEISAEPRRERAERPVDHATARPATRPADRPADRPARHGTRQDADAVAPERQDKPHADDKPRRHFSKRSEGPSEHHKPKDKPWAKTDKKSSKKFSKKPKSKRSSSDAGFKKPGAKDGNPERAGYSPMKKKRKQNKA